MTTAVMGVDEPGIIGIFRYFVCKSLIMIFKSIMSLKYDLFHLFGRTLKYLYSSKNFEQEMSRR